MVQNLVQIEQNQSKSLVLTEPVPEMTPDISIMMFKPDVYLKPALCSEAAHDIVLGLGDILCGVNSTSFYKSPHGTRVTQWALNKWGVPALRDEAKKDEAIIGLESLRSTYSEEQEFVVLEDFIYSILHATGYNIVSDVECEFTDEWIDRLYPYLLQPSPVHEQETKLLVRDALKSGSLRFLFLEGPMGHDYLDIIKFFLRKTLRDYTKDIINPAESMVHVPDPGEEKERTFALLKDYFSQ